MIVKAALIMVFRVLDVQEWYLVFIVWEVNNGYYVFIVWVVNTNICIYYLSNYNAEMYDLFK